MIPGSVRLVLNKDAIVNKNNIPPIIGMAIVTFSARYLQLKGKILKKKSNHMREYTYSNIKNKRLVAVIKKTVSKNTPEFGAVINLPSQ